MLEAIDHGQWSTAADMSDGEPTHRVLAIRFATSENADLFKKQVEELQKNLESDEVKETVPEKEE